MLKPTTAKNARRRNQARRSQQKSRSLAAVESPHQKAIRRLTIELEAGEGLFCIFHGGVDWRCARALLPRHARFVVKSECPVWAGGRRFIPDLKILCARTHRALLLIEVWHSHVVSPSKRRAYNRLGIPWVEVNSWHVLQRYRKRPLPILDWGGIGMPDAPFQGALFGEDEPLTSLSGSHMPSRRTRQLPWRKNKRSLDPVNMVRLFDEPTSGPAGPRIEVAYGAQSDRADG